MKKNTMFINSKLVRIQTKIPPGLRSKVKAAAAIRMITIEDWINESIMEKLEREKEKVEEIIKSINSV